ncbi:hypothetical protein ABTX35_02050 [Streptomyces sp. NPDC096080]|uniref:hypothetical protein n=1 Tax=Streptomyces sp. NPDC096080 TaxID=3156693 RepID=UPI00332728C5
MATIGKAGLPVPGGGDGPTVPAHLAELASAIDGHLVQHVTDLADRTATLGDAPVQTLAVARDGTAWLKTSATTDTWVTIWEPDPAWRTISLAAGLESITTTPRVSREGRHVWVRGRVQKTNGTVIGATSSEAIGTVPADCYPKTLGQWAGGASLTGDPMTGVCRIEVASDQQSITTGTITMYTQDGIQSGGAMGVMWVDIAGHYTID